MLTLLEQIDKGTIWRSHGGIHPPELKALSNRTAIETLPLAKQFILPIPQVGDSALLTIKAGDHVLKGQALTVGTSFAHCPVHAPTSGTIAAIKPMPSNHASGLAVLSCILIADGKDEAAETNISEISKLDNQQILKKIQDAGIAGLGGAAFPTHIKLQPASDIELVIINGIECEPYITSDDRLMQENSDEIIAGIAIIERLLTPKRIIIAIEDNKPEAFEAMQHSLNRSELSSDKTRITSVPTKYPSGGERQLIQILTGQEVPSGAIPAQLGMLVQNVGTAYAIQDAVINGQPLISRVVTVTGQNSEKPGNYWVPIGTQVDHVLQTNGFKGKLEQDKVIIGGPMMGHSLPDIAAPVLKGTNCILLPSSDEIAPEQPEMPCIRCGECAVACPALLLPQQLFWHAQAQEYDKAASFNLNDCIECGCCSYVCPSDIPLVEYYRVAKSALRTQSEEKKQADFAKQRFDARQQRLEDEKLARENKAKEAAERRKNNMTGTDKNAVAEAMARIKAKKAADASADNASTEPVQDKKAQVAAAIARAKAKKSLSAETTTTSTETNDVVDDKKAKINAAIARAKAKKAQQANPADSALIAEPSSTAVDDKKAKVAAAIARAKAKKQSQSANVVHNQQLDAVETAVEQASELNSQAEAPLSPEEIKKARIAAAVAKAKAKKAQTTDNAQSTQVDAVETDVEQASELNLQAEAPQSAEEIKKARIAAAVAKAKAKKAQTTDNAQSTQVNTVKTAVEQASELNSQAEAPLSAEEIKKARIAAAVAKAKAKKAQTAHHAQSTQVDTVKTDVETVQTDAAKPSDVISQTDALQSPEDIKKARVAAAVAKAKAKKAKAKLEEKE